MKEGERLLQERMKLLMFADTEGWSAANIYAGKVEVGSNSEDEKCGQGGEGRQRGG